MQKNLQNADRELRKAITAVLKAEDEIRVNDRPELQEPLMAVVEQIHAIRQELWQHIKDKEG